jgi:3-methyladenine DNA glycosylase AlkC
MSVRQRVMSVLTLAGCLAGLVAIPLGWGAHEPLRFCRTAAECPDLRWPAAATVPVGSSALGPALP